MKLHRVVGARHRHLAGVLAVGLLVALASGSALAKARPSGAKDKAKDKKAACEVAYQGAKDRVENARLIEAKGLLEKCVSDTCDGYLQKACATLYTQLTREVPSVVPLATDDKGAPLALVEVRMDGTLLTSKLDGLSVPIDPGKHEFSFSTDNGVFATKKVMILQGERNRTISVMLHSAQRQGRATATADAAHKAPVHKVTSPALTVSEAVAPKDRRSSELSKTHLRPDNAASRRYE